MKHRTFVFKANKNKSRLTEAKVVASCQTEHLHSSNVKEDRGMVLLKMKDGRIYYLTPSKPIDFVEKCNLYLKSV